MVQPDPALNTLGEPLVSPRTAASRNSPLDDVVTEPADGLAPVAVAPAAESNVLGVSSYKDMKPLPG
mgnify:CR=1 FL=1